MLAAAMENSKGDTMSFDNLRYPLAASIKLDGIRCIRANGKSLSRSFKEIPNRHIQSMMSDFPDGLDGELISLDEHGAIKSFSDIQSDIMTENGQPRFIFKIFDYVKISLSRPYIDRIKDLVEWHKTNANFCELVLPTIIHSSKELSDYEEAAINAGHEGIMTRSLDGPYKCGRSSFKEQFLVKIKRFADSEAVIVGFEERLQNTNEATLDELGYTKRSLSKSGLMPTNKLGTLIVKDIYDDRQFGIGTGKGLDDRLRKHIWDNKAQYIGKIIRYRYQQVGSKDLPRIPSFQGFRHEDDMG